MGSQPARVHDGAGRAGLDVTYSGTFGIIIPTGTLVGALLGWAEYQRRIGHQYGQLIAAPLLIGIIPNLVTAGMDLGPIGLALVAMAGGYAISSRGPLWTRIVAGIINLSGVAVTFLAPKPFPDLSYTTPHGLWLTIVVVRVISALLAIPAFLSRCPDLGHDRRGLRHRGHHRRPDPHAKPAPAKA